MARSLWKDPAVHTNYHTLRESIVSKANMPGGVDINQALTVHRRWKQFGKLVQAGRLK